MQNQAPLKLRCLSTGINLLLRSNGSLLRRDEQYVDELATILTSMYVETLREEAIADSSSTTIAGEKVAAKEVIQSIFACKAQSGPMKDHLVLTLSALENLLEPTTPSTLSELKQAISNYTASLVTAHTTSQVMANSLASSSPFSQQAAFCLSGLHLHEYFRQPLRLTHSVYA